MKFFSSLSLTSLTTLLAVVSVGFAAQEEAVASPDSAVVKLTADKFASFIGENPLVLAEFFAPWCGHCKTLGPHFSQAADELEPKGIKLAQVDCTENQELCQEQGIRGYPTLKVFRGADSEPSDYEGQRNADGIVKYMLKQSMPAVSILDSVADFDAFLEEATGAVVVETGVKDNATFTEYANTHRDDYTFVQTTSEELIKQYGADKILVFVEGSDEPVVFDDELTLANLDAFVTTESFPYVGELDGASYQKYSAQPTPLAYFFYNTAEEREAWVPKLTELAKANRGKINFVAINAALFGRHADNLNMAQEFPCFVIHDTVANKKYGVPQTSELVESGITELVEKYVAGTAEAIVKSEEAPVVQEHAVFKIVGSTHDKVVNDETKDVLVKYYAPWCGHCKKLAPIYEELAELYANDAEASEKVVIANLDGTLNDVAVEITGYPTLVLYPAGDKSNPIVHKGGRDLQSLIEFIKEQGTHGVDASDFEAPVKAEKEEKSKAETERDEL